jgi:hypothetical protein
MPEDTPAAVSIEIVDDGQGAELLIDRVAGVDVTGGVVRLRLAVDRTDPRTRQMRTVVTVRLACSLAAFAQLHDALGQARAQLERAGVLQRPAPAPSAAAGNGGTPPAGTAPPRRPKARH